METIYDLQMLTIEDARRLYNEASDALHQAQRLEYRVEGRREYVPRGRDVVAETIAARERLMAIQNAAIAQFGDPVAATHDGVVCSQCLTQTVFEGGPRHQASSRCRSGQRAHCSCDTCF